MIGRNKITINQATLCKAVEHYFGAEVFATGAAPKVESVEQTSYNDTDTFTVTVLSQAEAAKLEGV